MGFKMTILKGQRCFSLTLLFLLLFLLSALQIDIENSTLFWQDAQAAESHSGSHQGGHDAANSGRGKGSGSHTSDDSHADSHSDSKGGKKGHNTNRSPSDAVKSDVLTGRGRSSRPVWAGGGIPHVELGRLNVSRAPGFVLDRALAEVQAELASNPLAGVHSPLGNLALYRELMKLAQLTDLQIQTAAGYLGKAADKNTPIFNDTVEALNIILGTGFSLNNDQITSLASQADAVRSGILATHGSDEHADQESNHSDHELSQ